MNDYPDNELIGMVCENNEDASEILYNKYNFIVTSVIKKYFAASTKLGIEYAELRQEALVGFSDALASYDQDKEANLKTFITLCVDRRVNNFVRKMASTKEAMYKENLSLDMEVDDDNHSLYEFIKNDNLDPAEIIESNDEVKNFIKEATSLLSDSENQVLQLMLEEYSHEDIAKKLNMPIKSVYNKIARIRAKLKK